MTCIDKKLETLRKKRSKLTEEIAKIQKEIDAFIFAKYNFNPDKYIDKIIKYFDKLNNEIIIIQVSEIIRKSTYFEIKGKKLGKYFESDIFEKPSFETFILETNESVIIPLNDIETVQIISKEEANKIIQNYFDKFKF